MLMKTKFKPKKKAWLYVLLFGFLGEVHYQHCCFESYIGKTGRNLITRLTEHKRATRNGDVNNHTAEHHLKTKHQIYWDSATCITYSTDYYQRLTLESWFTNLEQTPLNRSQQLPAPYKRLINEIKQNWLRENDWRTDNLTNNIRLFNCDNRRIETHQLLITSFHSQ